MGLFVRKENSTSSHLVPAYTIGASKTVLIVGLGNPGTDYNGTRHNIGYECLDNFADSNGFPAWISKKDLKCHLSQNTLGDVRVILAKPTTFMNLSGASVRSIMQFYKIQMGDVAVVHDELDLPFGIIRTQHGGGTAGHNGLKSIIEHGSDDFGRIRIGIKNDLRTKMDGADFVLAKFSGAEQTHMKALTSEVNAILTEYIFGGTILMTATRNFIIET